MILVDGLIIDRAAVSVAVNSVDDVPNLGQLVDLFGW
jgi:hypothetical protein